MKSIVVDDDNSFRLIIEQFCNKTAGLQLEESFSNAMEAIKFLNANTVDLIFLDKNMNVVDIKHNFQPCRQDPCPSYTSKANAKYVLEINAGLAEKFKIEEGNKASLSK